MTLRVTHCPVNVAGIPWENVAGAAAEGGRRAARRLQPREAAPRGRLVARPPRRAAAPARDPVRSAREAAPADRRLPLLLRADARAAVAPVPDPARGAEEERLPLPRLGHPRQDARRSSPTASAPDAEIVGSYDALRWVPEAHVVPPGLDLREFTPVPPSDNPRPLVVHAPSNREKKGTALRDRGLRAASRSTSTSSRASTTTRRASATPAPTSSSTS